MGSIVYRDSLSAWQGLRDVGGLELDGRDEDLATQLKNQIDPDASNLEDALATACTDLFLQALFQVIQPFALMFRDVLHFFERAGAHEGQTQWKVSVGGEFVDLRHFEEFLQRWNRIECEVEIPAIGWTGAFIPNDVRWELGNPDYLLEGKSRDGSITTGIKDVDAWLAEYGKGRYAPFPESLHPDKLSPGLDDAARIVIAALSVIRRRGLDRKEMIAEHRARSYRCDKRDALHPWTIAQNETDYWLRSTVQYLAMLLLRPEEERNAFGTKLVRAYAKFPRRRISAHIQVEDLERLLSLPAWRKRYELYGVWVATAIVGSLEDHEVTINHANGELKFAFGEARIADVETSRPKVSLYSERRTPLASPVGKGRVSSVQPDFGLWACRSRQDDCVMIVEVKHYKRRSRSNFREALIDYASAHPRAMVVLVNYGPVGSAFADLPNAISDRCKMIGYLNPENPLAQDSFRKAVQTCVGTPVVKAIGEERTASAEVIVVDSSQSMSQILRSDWFMGFIDELKDSDLKFAFVDSKIREFGPPDKLRDWLSQHNLGLSTSLSGPVAELLKDYERIVVVTDQDGRDSLNDLRGTICELNVDNQPDVRLLQISKPDVSEANVDHPGDLKRMK